MLVVGSKLVGAAVMSLHVGGEVARTEAAVVDPDGLKVIGYRVAGPLVRRGEADILRTRDVREYGALGLIVDSMDELVARGDVVRIDEVLALNFDLVGLKVVSKKGKRLGRVSDYLVDTDGYVVQKIVVRRPIVKGLLDPELVIDRSEIVEVDDYKIVVRDEEAKLKLKEKKMVFAPTSFVNPFREPQFAPFRRGSLGGGGR